MKLRDYAKSVGIYVGCQSDECRWGPCDGEATVDYCDCDDARGTKYELEDLTEVAVAAVAEIERLKVSIASMAEAADGAAQRHVAQHVEIERLRGLLRETLGRRPTHELHTRILAALEGKETP